MTHDAVAEFLVWCAHHVVAPWVVGEQHAAYRTPVTALSQGATLEDVTRGWHGCNHRDYSPEALGVGMAWLPLAERASAGDDTITHTDLWMMVYRFHVESGIPVDAQDGLLARLAALQAPPS